MSMIFPISYSILLILGMFADDTYITVTGSSCGDIEPKVKSDLKAIEEWLETTE